MISRGDIVFKRILVTGANGLLGQALVQYLAAQQSYDVLATGRDKQARFASASCGYISLDITDFENTRQLFLDFEPDVVVNCAAMTQVDLCETEKSACWKVNVDAVEHLVKLCRTHSTKLVHVSTDFIFDGESGPYKETDRPDPVNYYGKSKVASENAVRSLPDKYWTIIRTVLVYGHAEQMSRTNIATWIIDNLALGKSINVVTDQFRSPTYVEDLARGIEKSIRYEKYGVFHISGRDMVSIFEFATKIAEVFSFDKDLLHPVDASTFSQTAERPPKTGFIILKAETELGYRPLTFEQALTNLASKLNIKVGA